MSESHEDGNHRGPGFFGYFSEAAAMHAAFLWYNSLIFDGPACGHEPCGKARGRMVQWKAPDPYPGKPGPVGSYP